MTPAWSVRVWSGNRLERSTVAFTGAPAEAARYYAKRCAALHRGFVMLCDHTGRAVETRHVANTIN